MTYLKKFRYLLSSFIFMWLAFGVLWLAWHSVKQSGLELQAQIQTIANQNAFENNYRKLVKTVEETTLERNTLENFILKDDSDTIKFLSDLDNIATAQTVEFSTQSLKLIEEKSDFNSLSFQFNISGPENKVINMIHMFETLPFHGSITSLVLQRNYNPLTGTYDVNATINLVLSIKKHDK